MRPRPSWSRPVAPVSSREWIRLQMLAGMEYALAVQTFLSARFDDLEAAGMPGSFAAA